MKFSLKAALITSSAIAVMLGFVNCSPHNSDPSKDSAEMRVNTPPSGEFITPKWEKSPNHLPIFTIRSEEPVRFNAPTVQESSILIYSTGMTDYRYEETNFNTIRATEIGSSGGIIHLTVLPDRRYQFFVTFSSEHYGSTGTQITREVGTYELMQNLIVFRPQTSSSETLFNGQLGTKSNSLSPKTYEVTSAVFEDLGIVDQQKINNGVVLRGPCPDYILPGTCSTSSSAEIRLQGAVIKN